jgi:hypothetical protein
MQVPKPRHPGSAVAEPERHTVYLDERRPVRDRDAALRVLAFRAVERFAVAFFAVDFFFAAAFFTPAFFAVAFLAVDFRADPERELVLFAELRLEERDVDRAAAGTVRAISGASSTSSIVVSPMVDSPPHVSSAPTVGSPHEPAVGVSDASPVPLQSSSVM